MKREFSVIILTFCFFLGLNGRQAQTEAETYVWPKDTKVLENLKRWQGYKFGLLVHEGLYSQLGIVESWELCPEDWVERTSTRRGRVEPTRNTCPSVRTLGRNTFRGPLLHNVDISLIKETPLVREALKLQFRAEVFNVFNLVNLGLPANIVLGPGFGLISRTAAPSRQIQFSLKLLY